MNRETKSEIKRKGLHCEKRTFFILQKETNEKKEQTRFNNSEREKEKIRRKHGIVNFCTEDRFV